MTTVSLIQKLEKARDTHYRPGTASSDINIIYVGKSVQDAFDHAIAIVRAHQAEQDAMQGIDKALNILGYEKSSDALEERVARAIWESPPGGVTWETTPEYARSEARVMARAALREICRSEIPLLSPDGRKTLEEMIADKLEATTPLKYECRTNYMVAACDVLKVMRPYLRQPTESVGDELWECKKANGEVAMLYVKALEEIEALKEKLIVRESGWHPPADETLISKIRDTADLAVNYVSCEGAKTLVISLNEVENYIRSHNVPPSNKIEVGADAD